MAQIFCFIYNSCCLLSRYICFTNICSVVRDGFCQLDLQTTRMVSLFLWDLYCTARFLPLVATGSKLGFRYLPKDTWTIYMSTAGAGDRTTSVRIGTSLNLSLCFKENYTYTLLSGRLHTHVFWWHLSSPWRLNATVVLLLWAKSIVKWMPCVDYITFHMQSLLSFACHCLLFYITRETVMWSPQVMARTWSA